jgi:asparagine synthase (glutamine-hydrolysing)
LASRESGFTNVTEILAGERVSILPTGNGLSKGHEVLWSPAEHCIDDEDAVPDDLRAATQSCIDAWSSVHRNIVLQLSGGFDSSVVLGCLRRVPVRPTVTCINRFGDEAGEDERRFARAVTRRAGVELDELSWRDCQIRWTDRLSSIPVSPKPSIPALLQVETQALSDCVARVRAHACWSGQGGDHLFFQFRTERTVADYVHRHGLRPSLAWIIRDAARLTHRPYAPLVALALRTRWCGSSHLRDSTHLPEHPWIDATATLPLGKHLQVKGLLELLNRHGTWTRSAPYWEVHPLISRPLIEWCLRLPSWIALRGGRSRSFARDAFSDYLPRVIRERDTKGRTTWFLMHIVRRDARLIGDLLLEGMVARQGLLDCAAIDRQLRHGQPLRKTELRPLLAALAAEVWLRTANAVP